MRFSKIRVWFTAACLLFVTVLAGTAQAGGAPTDAMLANTCAGCHGTNGDAAGPAIPSISSMKAATQVAMMKEFASGERPSTIMGRIAKGYSDAEIQQIANFFEKQAWVRARKQNIGGNFKRGKKLHSKMKCKNCHENNGRTQDAEEVMFRLAGQHPEALVIMMQNYKTQKFPATAKSMTKRIKKLTDQQMKDLATFYSRLK
ncbi:c-type cytochrome [Magnetococcales bacterium HHB-1]